MPLLTRYDPPLMPRRPSTSGLISFGKLGGFALKLTIARLIEITNVNMRNWSLEVLASPFGSHISFERSIFPNHIRTSRVKPVKPTSESITIPAATVSWIISNSKYSRLISYVSYTIFQVSRYYYLNRVGQSRCFETDRPFRTRACELNILQRQMLNMPAIEPDRD